MSLGVSFRNVSGRSRSKALFLEALSICGTYNDL